MLLWADISGFYHTPLRSLAPSTALGCECQSTVLFQRARPEFRFPGQFEVCLCSRSFFFGVTSVVFTQTVSRHSLIWKFTVSGYRVCLDALPDEYENLFEFCAECWIKFVAHWGVARVCWLWSFHLILQAAKVWLTLIWLEFSVMVFDLWTSSNICRTRVFIWIVIQKNDGLWRAYRSNAMIGSWRK